jgi:outer membrane protein assembly factor BamB
MKPKLSLALLLVYLICFNACVTFDGWRLDRGRTDLSAFYSEEMSPTFVIRWTKELGASSRFSPVIGYGLIFVGLDDGTVAAIDPNTGDILWKFQAGAAVSNSAAVQKMKDLNAPYLWFTAEDGDLYALNAISGILQWKLEGATSTWQSSVNLDVPDQLFYNYSDGTNTRTRAINALNGDILWEQTGNISTNIPLTLNTSDFVIQGYAQGGLQTIRAFKQINGDLVWELPGSGAYVSGIENPWWGHLYFSSNPAEVFAFNNLIQTELWRKQLHMHVNELIEGLTIKPLPSEQGHGILIATTQSYIFALKAIDGTILWSHRHGGNFVDGLTRRTPMPAVFGDLLVTVEDAQILVLRDIFTGKERWNYRLDSSTVSSPALAEESIFIISGSGRLYRFSHCR